MHKNSTAVSTPMKPRLALVVAQMSDFAIEHDAISTEATGGVCWPMARLSVSTRPKWTGSMPTWWISGSTIGTVKMIAAAECRNMPMIRKKILSSSSTM